MCGFVGYKITEKRDSDGKIIKEMADTIVHRGPDDEGYYVDEGVALGFRRLSIIDLASGAQPMCNEDGTKVLVFNGEVYNFREIREKLVAAGHIFNSGSDSEVVLHGYEEYGEDICGLLRGMYAFVIWDKTENSLFGWRPCSKTCTVLRADTALPIKTAFSI